LSGYFIIILIIIFKEKEGKSQKNLDFPQISRYKNNNKITVTTLGACLPVPARQTGSQNSDS